MAIDFKIDDRGDFILSTPTTYDRLKLSWVNSNYPVLRIDFEQGQECSERKTFKRLKIDFVTDQSHQLNDNKFSTVSDLEELRQRIMIRLRTERGEMSLFKQLGSLLVTQRHEDIMSDNTKNAVEAAVYAEVNDILKKPKVVAVPKKKTGPFFCQNMNVYIYDDDTLIYTLSL